MAVCSPERQGGVPRIGWKGSSLPALAPPAPDRPQGLCAGPQLPAACGDSRTPTPCLALGPPHGLSWDDMWGVCTLSANGITTLEMKTMQSGGPRRS